MPDDASVQNFAEFLHKKNLVFEKLEVDGKTVFKVTNYVIPQGKYTGYIIQIGFPIPCDYPTTAPYGIHVKTDHGFTESIPAAENASPFGSDWKFWSRKVTSWNPGDRNSQYYFDHVNRWLELN